MKDTDRRERARAFAQYLADILDQGEELGFSDGDVEHAIGTVERARVAYFGNDGRDLPTRRCRAVLYHLHWAWSVIHEPIAENARHTPARAAKAIVDATRADAGLGLDSVPESAWLAAIEAFAQLKRPKFEGWPRIVFELLKPYGLTDAKSHKNLRTSFGHAHKSSASE